MAAPWVGEGAPAGGSTRGLWGDGVSAAPPSGQPLSQSLPVAGQPHITVARKTWKHIRPESKRTEKEREQDKGWGGGKAMYRGWERGLVALSKGCQLVTVSQSRKYSTSPCLCFGVSPPSAANVPREKDVFSWCELSSPRQENLPEDQLLILHANRQDH